MAGFDFVCPMNYPNRCDLPQTEVDYLQKDDGKKVGFLMYQFDGQDSFLEETIKAYFEPRNCRILDARNEPGSGVRICKICRLATASHFGIGVLSPQNLNAYLEFGLIWGQGKPTLFIVNEKRLGDKRKIGDLAFDVSSFMYIVYSNKNELENKLALEGPTFLEKVRVMGLYQQELIKFIRERLKTFGAHGCDHITFLRFLLLTGKYDLGIDYLTDCLESVFPENYESMSVWEFIDPLNKMGLLEIVDSKRVYFSELLLPILRQEAFKEI